jgi:hypothetical protein
MIAGSARVSADGQTLPAQQAALREAGAMAVGHSRADPRAFLRPFPVHVVGDVQALMRSRPVPVRAHFFNF